MPKHGCCLLQELQRRSELTELQGQLAAVQQTLSSKADALETALGTHGQLCTPLVKACCQVFSLILHVSESSEASQVLTGSGRVWLTAR